MHIKCKNALKITSNLALKGQHDSAIENQLCKNKRCNFNRAVEDYLGSILAPNVVSYQYFKHKLIYWHQPEKSYPHQVLLK